MQSTELWTPATSRCTTMQSPPSLETIDGKTPAELRSELEPVQVKVDEPKMPLPLARYHLTARSRVPGESADVGVPMLLDYDTSRTPLYPRDGLLCSATAVYRRVNGERHLSLLSRQNTIKLNGSTFALHRDDAAPIAAMSSRGRSVARQWFSEHASTGFDARADRNVPDGAVRSGQGNRFNRARSAMKSRWRSHSPN